MRSRVCESLTQISLYEGIEPHTDHTDLTEFARLMLNLTDASRCSWKRSTRSTRTWPRPFYLTLWDLTPSKKISEICGICVSHRSKCCGEHPWDLTPSKKNQWDLCEPQKTVGSVWECEGVIPRWGGRRFGRGNRCRGSAGDAPASPCRRAYAWVLPHSRPSWQR